MTQRFPLAVLPTPLVPARRLARAVGHIQLWVKRDDLTGFMLAGNKARQLERLVADALATGADTLVTGGGAGSNFCAGAAAAAAVAGLRCVLVLYGDPTPHPNLALARWHRADVRFTGDPKRESVDPALEQVAAEVRAGGGRPYLLPRGGATVVGALAYLDAGRELAGQLDADGIRPATVLVAAGSGATAAGLLAAAVAVEDTPWRLVAAAVSRPPSETATQILRLAGEAAARSGLRPPAASDVDILDTRGPGYGIPSEVGEQAARLAAETEGLLLDPVFSAKALGVLISEPELPEPVVFWHTGGQAAALAHLAGRTVGAVRKAVVST